AVADGGGNLSAAEAERALLDGRGRGNSLRWQNRSISLVWCVNLYAGGQSLCQRSFTRRACCGAWFGSGPAPVAVLGLDPPHQECADIAGQPVVRYRVVARRTVAGRIPHGPNSLLNKSRNAEAQPCDSRGFST